MDTSGRAVLFAGVTVVIALLGMFALGVNLLNGVAIAAALGVVLVLAASVTLLPALLGFVGRRVGEVGRERAARAAERPGFWTRWVVSGLRAHRLTGVPCRVTALGVAFRFRHTRSNANATGLTRRLALCGPDSRSIRSQ